MPKITTQLKPFSPEYFEELGQKMTAPSYWDTLGNKKTTPALAEPIIGELSLPDFYSQIDEVKDLPLKDIRNVINQHTDITDKKTAWQKAIEFLGGERVTLPTEKFKQIAGDKKIEPKSKITL